MTIHTSNLADIEIRRMEPGDDVSGFSCGNTDLDDFLREAPRLLSLSVVQVYLAFAEEQVVGYAALLNDSLKLATSEKKKLKLRYDDHPVIPGIKLARLAVATALQSCGLGTRLLRLAYHVARAQAAVGCRVLIVDAYPQSVRFYESRAFRRARKTPNARTISDDENVTMWLDLHTTPDWAKLPPGSRF